MNSYSHLFAPSTRRFVAEYETLDSELAAIRDRRKAMSVFEWTISAAADPYYIDVLQKSLQLGLSVVSKRIDPTKPHFRTFVAHQEDLWRVPAYHLLVEICSNIDSAITWTEELECYESMLLGYSDTQIAQWNISRRQLGVGRCGRPVYVVLSGAQRRAICQIGDRCFPLEMKGHTLEVILVEGGIAPIVSAEDVLLKELLTLARVWVTSALYDRILAADRFESGIIEKTFLVEDVAEFNRGLLDQIEFFEDGWPHRQ